MKSNNLYGSPFPMVFMVPIFIKKIWIETIGDI